MAASSANVDVGEHHEKDVQAETQQQPQNTLPTFLPGYSDDFKNIINYGMKRYSGNIFRKVGDLQQAIMGSYTALPAYLYLSTQTNLPLTKAVKIASNIGSSIPEIVKAGKLYSKAQQDPTEKFRAAFNFTMNSIGDVTKKKLRGLPKKDKRALAKLTQHYVFKQTFNPNFSRLKKNKIVDDGRLGRSGEPFVGWLGKKWKKNPELIGGSFWRNAGHVGAKALQVVGSEAFRQSLGDPDTDELTPSGVIISGAKKLVGNSPWVQPVVGALGVGAMALGTILDSWLLKRNRTEANAATRQVKEDYLEGRIDAPTAEQRLADIDTNYNYGLDVSESMGNVSNAITDMFATNRRQHTMYLNEKQKAKAEEKRADAKWWQTYLPVIGEMFIAPRKEKSAREALAKIRPSEGMNIPLLKYNELQKENRERMRQSPLAQHVAFAPPVLPRRQSDQLPKLANKQMPTPVSAGPHGRALNTVVPPPLPSAPSQPTKVVARKATSTAKKRGAAPSALKQQKKKARR